VHPDRSHEVSVHTVAVLVEDGLKRGQRHINYNDARSRGVRSQSRLV
jgi:hypothetical protein